LANALSLTATNGEMRYFPAFGGFGSGFGVVFGGFGSGLGGGLGVVLGGFLDPGGGGVPPIVPITLTPPENAR
jgi:hypothetical protein